MSRNVSAKSKKRALKFTNVSVTYLLLLAVGIFMFLPFFWSLVTSLRANIESITLPVSLFPKKIIWDNYANLFKDIDLTKYILNTVIITGISLFANLLICSLGGYAFAKFNFPGKKIIFNIFLASIMIPGIVLLLPQFKVIYNFPLLGGNDILGQGGTGLIDTFAGVILPGLANVYGVFFMKQFFVSTPPDIAEAARMDGANEFKIFFFLYLRMVVPALVTYGILLFNGAWNSFLWPYIIIQDDAKQVLAVALREYQMMYSDNLGPLMAASIIMCLPVFAVFIIGQRYFVDNFTFSGLKG